MTLEPEGETEADAAPMMACGGWFSHPEEIVGETITESHGRGGIGCSPPHKSHQNSFASAEAAAETTTQKIAFQLIPPRTGAPSGAV